MAGTAVLGWMLAVVAWSVAVLGRGEVAGLAPWEIATALGFASVALMLTGWAVERSRGAGLRGTAAAIGIWAVLLGALSGAYANRDTLYDAARSVGQDVGIGAPQPTVGEGGEVSVTRRLDGTFAIPTRVNDHDVRFLFDTGASSVVLSAETAVQIGIPPERLRFRVPVTTANGRGLAAPIVLDRISVGPIVMVRVPALVVRSGMLDGNLLGQTFLERLESYEVRGKRLVLRATKS